MATESEDYSITAHLFKMNRMRRRTGGRKYSFNAYALEAIQEKIDRDNVKPEVSE